MTNELEQACGPEFAIQCWLLQTAQELTGVTVHGCYVGAVLGDYWYLTSEAGAHRVPHETGIWMYKNRSTNGRASLRKMLLASYGWRDRVLANEKRATPTPPVAQNAVVAQRGQQGGTGQQHTEAVPRYGSFIRTHWGDERDMPDLADEQFYKLKVHTGDTVRLAASGSGEVVPAGKWTLRHASDVSETFQQNSDYVRVLLLGVFRLVSLLQLLEKHPCGLCPGDVEAELAK